MGGVPAETDASRAMSRDLKRRGFCFVGPTIVYAFMQSAGLVNDHLVGCFRTRSCPAPDPPVYSARMPIPIATVEVPASSANLGSGFDCFAAALSLKLRAELFPGDEAGILLNAHGEGAPGPNDDPDENLLLRGFREGLRLALGAERGAAAWRIEVSSMIPAARGLGSSAAAIVGGLLLGRRGGPPSAGRRRAAQPGVHPGGPPRQRGRGPVRRHHACRVRGDGHDPGAAPLPRAGGLDPGRLHRRDREPHLGDALGPPRQRPPPRGGRFRRAAPPCWPPRCITSDAGLLRTAMDDRLHQPYRLPLLPGTAELIDSAYEHGAAGAASPAPAPACSPSATPRSAPTPSRRPGMPRACRAWRPACASTPPAPG